MIGAAPARAEEQTYYRSYVPQGYPAVRENPTATSASIDLKLCEQMYARGDFIFYLFEGDALRKEKRLGKQSLDGDDIKWIMSAENRKEACLKLLDKANKLSLIDKLRRRWNGN